MPSPIYLDHNASTPLLPEVVDAMSRSLREHFGNPSSSHSYGSSSRRSVEKAREQVAAFLGCDVDEVVFTSGGTEANNLAIRGIAEASEQNRHILTSTIEHPATEQPCAYLETRGWRVSRIAVDRLGRVDVDAATEALCDGAALVTVMHANNETGVIQPIETLALLARRAGALVHTDAAQSLGKIPLRVRELDVDLVSLAGHKLYAPKGVGALYLRRGTRVLPLMRGAAHERGLRPGTENVAAIVGLGAACEVIGRDVEQTATQLRHLRDLLFARLCRQIPGVQQNGSAELCLPNTLNVRFPRVSGAALLNATPEVAASTGSACHAGAERASPVLLAMGVPTAEALGSIRLSLGRPTTAEEVLQAAEALSRSWQRLVGA
jgi:cysteine desulfurase